MSELLEYCGFRIGDKVRIAHNNRGFYGHNVGRTATVAAFDHGSGLDVYVTNIEGGRRGRDDWGHVSGLELVVDAKVPTPAQEQATIMQRLSALEAEIAAIKELIG